MAIGYIIGGGGGGVTSSEVTATKENVLAGKTTVTSDSDDAVVNGTMPNIGKVTQTLGVNGSYTIPKGYHDGTGKVTQNLVTKAAQTYYATTSDQTIAAGQYLSGAQVFKGISQSGLASANILRGVTVNINNGFGNVWSVSGASNVLKYIVGSADLSVNYETFTISGYGQVRAYYTDITPGFTPVFALSISPQMYVWQRSGTYGQLICENAGGANTQGGFTGSWSFSASRLRLYGYPATGVPNPRGLQYWVFGY